MPDLIGSTLGPYRILEQIGLGGMATVYKAYQPGMDRLVALKILPEHFAAQPRFAQRFEREARIIAKLEHRNILPVYDFGQAGGLTYLVMRYLQAGTVKDILSHGPLPLSDAARVLSDIAAALDYAHAQGIVHRDVKPSNILVDKQGSAYLTDFGIAKVLEGTQELTGTSTLGTPAYMAPEQTLGKPVTPQSDVYSLGVMLYEMVTGKAPFESDTPMAVALMHVHEPLPLPRKVNPQISEAVELVILKALAKEPKDRYASAGDLARAFSAAAGADALAVPSRLLELAGVAATGKGSEEVTYDIREEIKKRERTERTRQVMRWAPFTVGGVIAVVLIAVALVYASSQAAGAQATVAYVANLPTATRYPTNTPLPTATATATAIPTPTAIPLAWARLNSGQFLQRDTITAIVVDPTDADVIYVGTENAGIYKSIDGGLSWQPVHNGLSRAAVDSLAIDPNDTQTVYAGLLLGGVYKTVNGGQAWRPMATDISGGWELTSIVLVDPQETSHLYFTHAEWPIYESRNAGASWTPVEVSTCPHMIVGLAIHPANTGVLFSVQRKEPVPGSCTPGVYKSTDGGKAWTPIGPEGSQSSDFWLGKLATDHQQGAYLYLAANDGLFGSLDGGATWRKLRDDNCTALAVDPADGRVAYCAEGERLVKTADAGSTWQALGNFSSVRAIAFSPLEPATILVGGEGLSISTDAGETWAGHSNGLGAAYAELRMDPQNSTLYLTNENTCRPYRSLDQGSTWKPATNTGCTVAFDADGKTQYWFSGSNSLWVSRDGGATGSQITLPAQGGGAQLTADPRVPGKLYYIAEFDGTERWGFDLWVSTDAGKTWGNTYSYNPSEHYLLCGGRLFFDPAGGDRVYAFGRCGTGLLSNDRGATWSPCRNDFTKVQSLEWSGWLAESASKLAIDPRDSDRLFVARTGGGVFTSTDGCGFWQPSNTGLGSLFVNSIAIDPNNPDTVYSGTDGGAYVSFDGGAHWGPVNDGLLGALVVYSIVIDPQSNAYAATPYGVFKLQPSAP